jgi:hypothetical protein
MPTGQQRQVIVRSPALPPWRRSSPQPATSYATWERCDVVRDLERRANDRLSGSPARDAGLHIQAVMTAAQLRRALGMPERANSRPGWQLREAWRRP